MDRINAEMYQANPERYILVSGDANQAPVCPFGNKYMWIGYDLMANKYVRFTKSVFKKLILEIKNNG